MASFFSSIIFELIQGEMMYVKDLEAIGTVSISHFELERAVTYSSTSFSQVFLVSSSSLLLDNPIATPEPHLIRYHCSPSAYMPEALVFLLNGVVEDNNAPTM